LTPLSRANVLVFLVPALLMAGALGSQHIGGLFPCQMCHWQRWPHYAAIALALVSFALKPPARNIMVALAALAILTSGAIGVFHAGVEYHWWAGPACSSTAAGASLEDIMRAPIISCDTPQWELAGISLAGFNAIFSILGGLSVLALVRKAR
jgi:disulfide bond formation protein DsbB